MNQRKNTSRVQGLWAGSSSSKFNSQVRPLQQIASKSSTEWAGKQSGVTTGNRHTFQAVPKEEIKDSPKIKILRENGEFELGRTKNGVSKIYLEAGYVQKSDADWMFKTLLNEINWKQQQNTKYESSEKRLTAWFSNYSYKYSGVVQEPNKHVHDHRVMHSVYNIGLIIRVTSLIKGSSDSKMVYLMKVGFFALFCGVIFVIISPLADATAVLKAEIWHPLVTALMDQLNDKYKLEFNSVLANYYRDGHDTVDWHTDCEPALGNNPPIASISFGDLKSFELREMPKMGADYGFSHSQHYRVPLTHGSLLLMLGATQHDWQHCVPREYHDRGPRINLTFRRMFPDNK